MKLWFLFIMLLSKGMNAGPGYFNGEMLATN